MYDIKDFLNIKDDDVDMKISTDDDTRTKTIHIKKILAPKFCPMCNYRMYSKGIYKRLIKHPILQDGYKVVISLSQRRWKCTNMDCLYEENDDFHFVDKYKRVSFITPYLIINEFRDINVSCTQVAKRFNISDTYVHETFLRYVDIRRLKLPRILSIDEVYLDIDNEHRFCVILMDFETGEIVDILKNRYINTLRDYFRNIDKEERDKVEYLISDMYDAYITIANDYLKNSKCIIDSFHVIAHINNKINLYINDVKKRYQKRDREKAKELDYKENRITKKRKDSREVYILKNYSWVLLKNENEIEHKTYRHLNRYLGTYVNTYDIEKYFLSLDPNFEVLRKLKEKYISFNSDYVNKSEEEIKEGLEKLIKEYKNSKFQIFKDFARMLNSYKKEIIASFYSIPKSKAEAKREDLYRRLSNGPMEGFNRKPKDMKRQARGYRNFDFIRLRILFASREKAPILAIPKEKDEVANKTGIKRGEYKKKK